jgi:hypothetical protein
VVTVAETPVSAERELLQAVVEALTLPEGTPDYLSRLADRAMWVRVTVKGALEEDPAGIGWNADYLRSKMRAEANKRSENRPK